MVVPNYTYLNLKMPGPDGIITIGTSFQRAYKCDVECYDHVAAIVASEELTAIRKEVVEEAPDSQAIGRVFRANGGRQGGPHRPQ